MFYISKDGIAFKIKGKLTNQDRYLTDSTFFVFEREMIRLIFFISTSRG